jgi:ankyrin repeat protein
MTATPQSPALTADELEFLHGMFDLARAGETAQLVEYVEAGLPVDLTNGAGDTLLVLAAYHDHPGTVRALLEHGADHTRVDDRGQTALAAAVFRRSPASVAALLAAGADPDHGGRSARQVADFFGLDDMAGLLPSAGDPRGAGRCPGGETGAP